MRRQTLKRIGSLLVVLVFGLAVPRVWAAAPVGQYTINADGTVVDHKSRLTWQQAYSALETWSGASTYCATLTLAGLSGWRLPTRFELETLVDVRVLNPTIDPKAFPGTKADWYWTSTPWVDTGTDYWIVYFRDGSSAFIAGTDQAYARCVR